MKMARDDRKRPSLKNKLFKKAIGRIYEDVEETVVPRTEDFIVDIFSSLVNGFASLLTGAFEKLIFHDDDDYAPGRKDREKYWRRSYDIDSRRGRRSSSVRREKETKRSSEDTGKFTDGLISCRNWNEIYYDNRRSAERLVKQIRADAYDFNGISVNTLYEYLQKTGGDFTDTYYGWPDLSHARVQAVGGKYWIRLPEPVNITDGD
jgi:hypothetical protein